MPNTNSLSILGSSNNFVSQSTPNNNPNIKVEPYNRGSLTKSFHRSPISFFKSRTASVSSEWSVEILPT